MKTKTNAEMLKAIKQYNKTAREDKAKKEGFKNATEMIKLLDLLVTAGKGSLPFKGASVVVPQEKKKPIVKVKVGVKPTIHVIDVLDSSGSMSGGKIAAAIKGVNHGIETIKNDKVDVNYTYTLCDFSDDLIFRYTLADLKTVSNFRGGTRGSTALYDAIGKSVALVKPSVKDTDKVLVNIYTDGEENTSRRFRANDIASLIEELSKVGWTFTFIGTQRDVDFAQRNLKFDISNTLVHDNTPESLSRGMQVNSVSRSAYSSKVAAGEDVSKGFYKDIE
jgi:uncharacterized protein YegL